MKTYLFTVDEVRMTSQFDTLCLINPQALDENGTVGRAANIVAYSLPDGLKPGDIVRVTVEKVKSK